MNRRFLLVLLVIALLLAAAFFPGTVVRGKAVVHQHRTLIRETPEEFGFQSDGSLTTCLPILILHTDGMEVPGTNREDIRVLTCGYEFITGDVNSTTQEPSLVGNCSLRVRGQSSRKYPKQQYTFKTVDEQGLELDTPLLGMPEDSRWVLNGCYVDHSMIRNYLAYNLAGEIMGYAPRIRFCEVFLTDAAGMSQYAGVYTLCERIRVSEGRLNLEPTHPGHTETSFLLQINPNRDHAVIANLKPDDYDTYPVEVEYPGPTDLTEASYHYIEKQLLIFEKAMYDAVRSGNWDAFHSYVDLDSFVDYYIINEFFQNIDAGNRSTFLYQNMGGKLAIGPVWDFDLAMGKSFEREDWDMQVKLRMIFYYHCMFQDPEFLTRCISRYHELRRTLLSEEYLLNYVDTCAESLAGPARRNCERWYGGDLSLWQEDIETLKDFFRVHGAWMDKEIESLRYIIK